ncbi:MAG: formylglycine-generating enzyme family protein [Chloroflexi bacterium]|nr:formylglycine-generating enzyme family protein [Chloroflexota bacterium]
MNKRFVLVAIGAFLAIVLVLALILIALKFLGPAAPGATDEPGVIPSSEATPASPGSGLLISGPGLFTRMIWYDGAIMVYIPPGEFMMGVEEGKDNPEHMVYVGAFWMYEKEVSNRMYARCVAAGGCSEPDWEDAPEYWDYSYGNYPVRGVSWYQAFEYCEWIGAGLPTEAQWEKAARGPESFTYPWGEADPACGLLNFDDCLGGPTKVNDYKEGKSYYDILNMAGNVFEWNYDWYDPDYYLTGPTSNPSGPELTEVKSFRGGGYDSAADLIPSALRFNLEPKEHRANIGFRCQVTFPGDGTGSDPLPPVCVALPFIPPAEDIGLTTLDVNEFPTPVSLQPLCPEPDVTILGIFNIGATTYINLDLGVPISDPAEYDVSVGLEELTCSLVPSQPTRLSCYSNSLPKGSFANLHVCVDCPEATVVYEIVGDPVCPSYTSYDPATGLCLYDPALAPETGCPDGMVDTPDYGCLPIPDSGGDCPPGYYLDGGGQVCVPAGGPTLCIVGLSHMTIVECPQECLPGYHYDPELGCCQPNEGILSCPPGTYYDDVKLACVMGDPQPVCPKGSYFDVVSQSCQPWTATFPGSKSCYTESILIPVVLPTATSTATPVPPPPTSTPTPVFNCGVYTDKFACEADSRCYYDYTNMVCKNKP